MDLVKRDPSLMLNLMLVPLSPSAVTLLTQREVLLMSSMPSTKETGRELVQCTAKLIQTGNRTSTGMTQFS